MVFSDPQFFVFFAGYLLLHFIVPNSFRLWLIIIGSAIFYAFWRIEYLWIPFELTLVAWAGTIWTMHAEAGSRSRRVRLTLTLIALFLPLALVKYAFFVTAGIVEPILGWRLPWTPELKWALPLGISFVTFTLTAYVVDVVRGRFGLVRDLRLLLAYVLFFPHLVAGPILRPHELIPQLKQDRDPRGARFTLGFAIFTLGLVKKTVFADPISNVVDAVYAANAAPTGWEYLLAIYGFSMQIYCDFSGYTDMAIGVAYILRIRLPTNFLRPYTAVSIVEFWRRWHISLSHWLRDYLYIPLGGNRLGPARQVANIVVTMLLGGLWHGANWTFVIWGALHGIGLAVVHQWRVWTKWRLPDWVGILITFHFVTILWVFFRAADLGIAFRVLAGPLSAPWPDAPAFASRYGFELALLAIFLLTHRWDRHSLLRLKLKRIPRAALYPGLIALWALAFVINHGSSAKFIYFDF